MLFKKKSKKTNKENSNSSPQPPKKEKGWLKADGKLTVDVFETNSNFVVQSPIAGVSTDDIDISIDKDILLIKGNRKNPTANKNKKYYYKECHFGPFSRKIILPENVNSSKISAAIDNGILTIKIPKTNKSTAKEIKVKK